MQFKNQNKEKRNYKELKNQKQFLKLLVADTISRFGDSLDIVAYSWIMYEITGSEALLAIVMGLNYIPTIFLMPFTGALTDNLNKKTVMIIADFLRFCIVVSIAILYITNNLTSGIIIIFTLLTSTVEAFRIPAASALMPSLLDKDKFTIGQAASFTFTQISTLLGFSLAGLSIALIGSGPTLLIDGLTFLCSALLIFAIKNKEKIKTSSINLRKVIVNFIEGAQFFLKNKAIQTLALLGVLLNLSTMALSIFQTPYVQDYLNSGAEMLSYIKTLSALSIGIGAAIAPKITKIQNSKVFLISGIVFGGCFILAAIVPYIPYFSLKMIVLTISMLGMGLACGFIIVVSGACKMKAVPLDMMGRITGIYGAIMQTALPVSSFICSFLVLYLPLTYVWAIFGILSVFSFLTLFFTKRLKALDNFH